MFVLHTSEDSLTEVLYWRRKHSPISDGSVTSRIQQLVRAYMDQIHADYEGVEGFPGEDIHDSHIHAAAIEARADYLIANDGGFHEIDPGELPYEVHSADTFLMLVAENAPPAVVAVILRQLEYYKKRGDAKPLGTVLRDAGCPNFAKCVEEHLERMASGRSGHDVTG